MNTQRALSYEELFGRRGSSYDRAMLAFPEARAQGISAQVIVPAGLKARHGGGRYSCRPAAI